MDSRRLPELYAPTGAAPKEVVPPWLPSLAELLARVDDHRGAEDGIHRCYHHGYKVFRLQDLTTEIIEALSHARFFLQMAIRYGRDLGYAPSSMPSG